MNDTPYFTHKFKIHEKYSKCPHLDHKKGIKLLLYHVFHSKRTSNSHKIVTENSIRQYPKRSNCDSKHFHKFHSKYLIVQAQIT